MDEVNYDMVVEAMTKARDSMFFANKALQEAAIVMIDGYADPKDGLLFDMRMARTQVFQLAHFAESILQRACKRLAISEEADGEPEGKE